MANPFDTKDYGSVTGRGSGFQPSDSDFVKIRQRLSDACLEISRQTNELRRLGKSIGTQKDDDDLRQNIYELRKSTFENVESATELFNELLGRYSENADRGQEIAIGSLRQTFSRTANEFGQVYEQIVNKLQENPRPVMTDSEVMDHSDEEGDIKNINDSSQLIQEHDSIHASFTEQRARQMDDLQGDMVQLRDIMGSIQRIVVEHGEVIDDIETHVERAGEEVVRGRSELGSAVRYKRCNRRLTVIITLIVLVIVAVVVIVAVILICGPGHACKNNKK